MKRQEAFDRMRKNRDTARLVDLRRESTKRLLALDEQKKVWAEEDRKHKEEMARFDDFMFQSSILSQMACMPLMGADYYADLKDRAIRLANEHGVKADKPRRELKVVGGKP